MVPPADLLLDFVPPPRFTNARFSTYQPDRNQPSQTKAVDDLRRFSLGIGASHVEKHRQRRKGVRGARKDPSGVYIDGGFGVGKTHLLAALYQTAGGRRSYGTFSEYANVIDALGPKATLAALAKNTLVCIDEFELDRSDEMKSVVAMTSALVRHHVKVAAASISRPNDLGSRSSTASTFKRDMKGLGSRFEIVRIKGEDYLRRDLWAVPQMRSNHQVAEAATQITASLDSFDALIAHLSTIHPSEYAALLNGLRTVCVQDVRQLENEDDALRFVVFVDRLYDRNLAFVASGLRFDRVFSPPMLAGPRRDRYLRAVARLNSLAVSS
jgi:cell division protein ZapE